MNAYWVIPAILLMHVLALPLESAELFLETTTLSFDVQTHCQHSARMKSGDAHNLGEGYAGSPRSYEDQYYRDRRRTTRRPPTVASITLTCSNVTFKSGPLVSDYYIMYRCSHCPKIFKITSSVIPVLPSSAFIHFPEYTRLEINNTELETILPGAFNSLNSLKELYLSNNNLKYIPDGVFNSLVTLKVLDLSGNSIQNLSVHSLSGIMNLEVLNLSSNALNIFTNDFFVYLTQVKVLDLSSNHLSKFNFTQMSDQVQNLTLSNNHINELFGCFGMLTKLDVSKNEIKSLGNSSCDHRPSNILYLDFSYNFVEELNPKVFSTLDKMHYLFLQNNNITSIPNGCFSELTSLYSLNMSSNRLEEFQYGLFDKLYDLTILDISNNTITSFQKYIYHSLRKLEELYLEYNQIDYLNSKDMVDSLPNLKIISLDGNNFTCDILVEIFHNLKGLVPRGNTVNISNIHGIACSETKNSLNLDSTGTSRDSVDTQVEDFLRSKLNQLVGDDFKKSFMHDYFNKEFKNSNFFKYLENLKADDGSKGSRNNMYDYFNKDFKDSNFHKYLESLKNARQSDDKFYGSLDNYVNRDFSNSVMYKYFNKEFVNSNFYKYLETLKKPQFLVKYSENENDTKVEKLVSNFGEERDENSGYLVIIILLLVLIVCLLMLLIFVVYSKFNSFNKYGFSRNEVVELVDA